MMRRFVSWEGAERKGRALSLQISSTLLIEKDEPAGLCQVSPPAASHP